MNKLILALIFGFVLAGCGISASYVKTDDAKYPPTNSIKVLLEKPQEEFMVIGLISVSSSRSVQNDEEAVFEELKQKAR